MQYVGATIINACLSARVSFSDEDEIHRLWRYLNMMQIAAYCGLHETLTVENFLMPLASKYKLLGEGEVEKEESAKVRRIDVDESGARACSMFEVFALALDNPLARMMSTPPS